MSNKVKRIISWVLMLVMVMAMAPVRTAAWTAPEPIVTHEESELILNPIYKGVSEELYAPKKPEKSDASVLATARAAYASTYEEASKALREGMKNRQETIDVYYMSDNFDFSEDSYEIFLCATEHTGDPKEGDTLRWGWIYRRTGGSYYESGGTTYATLTYSITYHTTAEQEKELDEAVDDLLEQLNPTGNNYEKVCTIYDYICENITYDYANLNNQDYILKYSAYAALVDKTAVCQGYALLFYRLTMELGIDGRFIGGVGNGGPHGWNIVQLGKYYYNVDSTWDASWLQGVGYYKYFLLNEENFTEGYTDHFRDPEFDTAEFHEAYPIANKDFDPTSTPLMEAPELKVSNVASTGKIKLSWDAVPGAVKYQVYRAASKSGTYKLLKTVTGTSLTHSSAEAGKTYYYKVRAVDAEGTKSDFSKIVSRTCDLPCPVVTLSNVAPTGKIKISWEAVTGAVKYQVYRSTDKENWTLLKTVTGTSLTNSSAVGGKLYYYKVRAIAETSSANSAYSAVKSRRCDIAQPVVTLSNVASSGKIKISWKPVEGAVKYQVYRSTDNKNWTRLITTTGTSLTNSSAEAGVLYYYKVKAVASNSEANSAYSSVKSRTCDLPRPVVTLDNSTAGRIRISWAAIDGAVKYKVYRSTDNENWTLLKTVTGTSLNNTSVEAGKQYYYKVMAVADNSAANSAYSRVKSITAE